MIGTSGALTSTKQLSIPKPLIADIRCSTVEILTPSFTKVVDKVVSPTLEAFASMATIGSRSILVKTIPVFTGAGRKVK